MGQRITGVLRLTALLQAAALTPPKVLVVGGTGRIGTAVAIHLLQRRPELRVVLAGRSAERGRAAVDEVAREVHLPTELATLLESTDEMLVKVAANKCTDFEYWDKVHDAIEGYRSATEATFAGTFVTWSAAKLGKSTGVFGRMLARMDQGVARALSYAPDDGKKISPTYFRFTVTSYSLVGISTRGLPSAVVPGSSRTRSCIMTFLGSTRHGTKGRWRTGRAAHSSP